MHVFEKKDKCQSEGKTFCQKSYELGPYCWGNQLSNTMIKKSLMLIKNHKIVNKKLKGVKSEKTKL